MARELYCAAPVFRAALDRCAQGLAASLDRPLLDVLFPAEGQATPIDETGYTQPALFAVDDLPRSLRLLWAGMYLPPVSILPLPFGSTL
jgi:myxalamid-type polyketide synthase MxaB